VLKFMKGISGTGGTLGGAKGIGGSKRRSLSLVEARMDDSCAEVEKLEVRGVVPKVKGMPHMVYSPDGVYVKAVACYIRSQYLN
jgi:hypothetical protein